MKGYKVGGKWINVIGAEVSKVQGDYILAEKDLKDKLRHSLAEAERYRKLSDSHAIAAGNIVDILGESL